MAVHGRHAAHGGDSVAETASLRLPAEHRSLAGLDALAWPEVAFVLVVAGLVLVSLRIACPWLGWAGLGAGVAMLFLGCVGLQWLPVAAAGVLMLGFAAASLLMEVLRPSGLPLHAAGAIVSLVIAGLYLTGQPPSAHPGVVVPVAGMAGLAVAAAARRSLRYRRDRPLDTDRSLVGHGVIVLAADGHTGLGVTGGQVWQLRTSDRTLQPGKPVRVVAQHADHLLVEPVSHLDRW